MAIRAVGLWLAGLATPAGSVLADDDALVYETDVRPIFRAYCFDCHGASEEVKGDLDLRLVRFLLRGGKSGPAIVPGDPERSFLLSRVRAGEMPPGDTRLPTDAVEVLERWIALGARTARPEPAEIGPGLGLTTEERGYWAFQPIVAPVPPTARPAGDDRKRGIGADRSRDALDAFLLDARPAAVGFAQEADHRTLITRLSLDLLGLPPTRTESETFLADDRPGAYERLVDRTLASPHFGERWARHWLDVAGYADSEGATNTDAPRRWAYRYRDWVIRAFNADKPLDLFITEQLAGDELAGSKHGDWTSEQIDLLTATGFLRLAADGTGSGADDATARNQVVADTLKILGSALLGISIGCAQCHDHRYDPISQRDYYALRAVFEPALDPANWRTPAQRAISLYTNADEDAARAIEEEAKSIAAERATKELAYLEAAFEKELARFEEPLRDDLRRAYETPTDRRSDAQTALLESHPSVNITPGVLYQYDQGAADDLKKYDTRLAAVRARKPAEEFVRALVEPSGPPPPTHLLHRGDPRQPREEIVPGVPEVLVEAGTSPALAADDASRATSGRRLAFAHWLTGDANPLTARVLANRVWLHLFGRGLVDTPGEFGQLGTTPTHAALLDWLAATLRRDGWSLKRLVRRIVLSQAYRQSSTTPVERIALDPDNRGYSRHAVRRLDAEVLRDRILAASGRLDRRLYGPPVPVSEDDTGQVSVTGDEARRRSIYITAHRSRPVGFLQAFDAPVMETNCERRVASTAATQSLMLLNGAFVLEEAAHLAARARREAQRREAQHGATNREAEQLRVEATWILAYGRPARNEELESAAAFLTRQVHAIEGSGAALPEGRTPLEQAFVNLSQVLLISNEFLHVE